MRRWIVLSIILASTVAAILVAFVVKRDRGIRAYRDTEYVLMTDALCLEVYQRRFGSYPSPGFSGAIDALPEVSVLKSIADELHAERVLSENRADRCWSWGSSRKSTRPQRDDRSGAFRRVVRGM
jgi:hypothetical protein